MRKIVHILDDASLGGVTRLLDSLLPSLADGFVHARLVGQARNRLPPRIDATVIVVHFTMGWNKLPFLLGLRLRCPRARLILVEHTYTAGFEACNVTHCRRFRLMLRIAYRLASRIVAVSDGQKGWILHAGLAAPDRVVVIPCVLDLAPFGTIAAPPPHDGPLRLGAFGRFTRQKGFDVLIAAMRQVRPDCARLTVAGYGEDEAALHDAAAGLPHVEMLGVVNPVSFIATMDAIVMPSRWEAGAVSCWELRAAGRPSIVSDVDGLPEQVPPQRGLIVPPEDPDRLAAAVRALAAADRAAMSEDARRSTEGAFDRVVAAWGALLRGENRSA